jgi:hypothetical protein
VEACPERRDLVHGDLLYGNVLVSLDARRVEAVLSWKCSVRGDFLFDAAWCSFWAPFHPGVAATDPLSGPLQDPAVRAEAGALLDAAAPNTATSCTSASPTWAGTSGPETRLVSPRQRGVSRRSSSAAPAFDPRLTAARSRIERTPYDLVFGRSRCPDLPMSGCAKDAYCHAILI